MNRRLPGVLWLLLLVAAPLQADDVLRMADLAEESDEPALRANAHALEALHAELSAAAGVQTELLYSSDPGINAYATELDDAKIIVVQAGLLTLFEHDRDAVAAVLGHEIAHHKADHVRAGRRKQAGVRVLGAVVGAVVGAKVGRDSGRLAGSVAGTAVGVGAELVALKFNRTQELEADRLSIDWMVTTGHNPQGMLRVQQQLDALGSRRAAMFSTHPPSKKRYAAAEQHIARLAPPAELLARGTHPLADADALAAAQAAIEDETQIDIAAAMANRATPPAAQSLEPIRGYALRDFAALTNELIQAGEPGKNAVLTRRKLSDAEFDAIQSGFTQRLRDDPGLAQRYSIEYYRTAQGPLAAWGADLADSYEHGTALLQPPPLPFDVACELHRALRAHFATDLDGERTRQFEARHLQARNLAYYDYLLAHNWWTRHVTLAAMGGDPVPMQRYFGTDESDATARSAETVEIGAGVEIGSNVEIEGR